MFKFYEKNEKFREVIRDLESGEKTEIFIEGDIFLNSLNNNLII